MGIFVDIVLDTNFPPFVNFFLLNAATLEWTIQAGPMLVLHYDGALY
jgi:hypothetical protein